MLQIMFNLGATCSHKLMGFLFLEIYSSYFMVLVNVSGLCNLAFIYPRRSHSVPSFGGSLVLELDGGHCQTGNSHAGGFTKTTK